MTPAIGTGASPQVGVSPPAWRRPAFLLLVLVLLVSGSAMTLAMRRTSTTFDEIILIAGGARGYATGDWSIAPEHPPLTQYIYGLLPHFTSPILPDEAVVGTERYTYAQHFFFGVGNDPERLAFLGRLPGVLCALLLVLLVFGCTRRSHGDGAALLAAAVTAFLPDVLAHAGVAYNDVPVTLAIFAALWLADGAIRQPSLLRGAAFGIVAGLALGTKNSAVTLAPMTMLLLAAEAALRWRERAWLRRIPAAAAAAVAAVYVMLVAIYRGDPTLEEYRYSLSFVYGQVTQPGAPAYLMGNASTDGWWYYFPLGFLFKTSAAFHLLLALGAIALLTQFRNSPDRFKRVLRSPLRVPIAALAVLVPVLVTSNLNIGFRYALPALPPLAILAAVGAVRIWHANLRSARVLVAAATAWLILHPLSFYPNFLSYISEYGPGRDRNYTVLVDSSLDWGQGLLLLREFMREHQIDRVYLSYYGTAWPDAYGIDYVPLFSFLSLPAPPPDSAPAPRHIVVSATNLAGAGFLSGMDPYRTFREIEPVHVIGNTMFVFEVPALGVASQ